MQETPEDIKELQALLDASYAAAGSHLLSIHNEPGWRMTAEQVSERLTGMTVLSLATVNSSGQPIAGPVDGIFYRGRFYCGSAPDSLRAKHIRRNPAVSLTHTVGEELAITVHGTAIEVDKTSERAEGFREHLNGIYGQEMIDVHWDGTAVYWTIEPRKMFALAPVIPAS
jgi:nitroimidazol reductase NimA-like FMN-containing flavoprotein (pyridoxamine 5'-phosphate oxidase superfamily)